MVTKIVMVNVTNRHRGLTLYNKLIAYQIFEIGFDRRRQCLKIDFEDFNETMAILKKSNWV